MKSRQRRGQLKMGESIAVLAVFFFLLIFGFVFYSNYQKSAFERELKENVKLKAVQIAETSVFFPELQCSSKDVQKDNCIDIIKMEQLIDTLENDLDVKYDYYFYIFSNSNITIEQRYPTRKNWTLYSRQPTRLGDQVSTHIPISLYNSTSQEYYFGMINVIFFGEEVEI